MPAREPVNTMTAAVAEEGHSLAVFTTTQTGPVLRITHKGITRDYQPDDLLSDWPVPPDQEQIRTAADFAWWLIDQGGSGQASRLARVFLGRGLVWLRCLRLRFYSQD